MFVTSGEGVGKVSCRETDLFQLSSKKEQATTKLYVFKHAKTLSISTNSCTGKDDITMYILTTALTRKVNRSNLPPILPFVIPINALTYGFC